MADTLASPLAFELCEGCTCKDRKIEKGAEDTYVSCPPSDNCSKRDCYCQLFQRKKGSDDTVPWRVAPAGYDKQVKYKGDDFDYKCLCVKPILEADGQTIEDTKYATRYVLCGLGMCGLEPHLTVGMGTKEIQCTGACEGECKCTLFRLQVGRAGGGPKFDPKSAKWQYVAKADKLMPFQDGYVYRCFCLK